MSTETRTERLRAAVAAAEGVENPADLMHFLTTYYEEVTPEDLVEQCPQALWRAARDHRHLAAKRLPGQTLVDVSAPITNEPDGPEHTEVRIVTDDRRFLVSSVLGELRQQQRHVRLAAHPQLAVSRDADGGLRGLRAFDQASDDAVLESWMQFQIAPIHDAAERDELAQRLQRVLADVEVAVDDWRDMRDQCLAMANDLATNVPTGVDAEDASQVRDLLEWLADDKFVFLGYREYRLSTSVDGQGLPPPDADHVVLHPIPNSGLGILRDERPGVVPRPLTELSGPYARLALEPKLFFVTKANSRSSVHRTDYLDYLGVRVFDDNGAVIGERRFLGLFSSGAYSAGVLQVPYVRDKVEKIITASGHPRNSHLAMDLMEVLEYYPRDELFATDVDALVSITQAIAHMRDRPRTKLFLRNDPYSRYVSCLVYLPRDRYSTAARRRMEAILLDAFDGSGIEHTARVSRSVLAMVHFTIRVPHGDTAAKVEFDELERRMVDATRSWDELLAEELRDELGAGRASALMAIYAGAFPGGYKAAFAPDEAVVDVDRLDCVLPENIGLDLYRPDNTPDDERRLKVYLSGFVSLTTILPIFHHFGLEVTDQRPYAVECSDGTTRHLLDFGLRAPDPQWWSRSDSLRQRFHDAFQAVWRTWADSDALNSLIFRVDLDWHQVAMLRTINAFLQQSGWAYSGAHAEEALLVNQSIAAALIELFETRFDPDRFDGLADERRAAAEAALLGKLEQQLDDVASLEHERILKGFVDVICATMRTTHFTHGADPTRPVALKLASGLLGHLLPEPHPIFENWVYGPTVTGSHLRFGRIARGGLRWSDRKADFRTEVLGLVKAQTVKNAIIVPTGAKGGFVPRRLPDMSDRGAWLAAGRAAYRQFIGALLELTDNRVGDAVVAPDRVVRHDTDDPYLVVAADKGTASFSDLANEVAEERGFWLGDAFASGGSSGYDHKAMAITARGAWESVRRHFREMGQDTQTEEFTAVGIGDMSGDVFGNGMLRSDKIRLVGAFDHRHIFLDPNPDAAASYAERQRLYDLPSSSWLDYDAKLISAGGGVYPRTAKFVPISPQVREALGLADDVTSLTPAELMSAVLSAPVDLLWNGGVGTYVKASNESHADVGDRANDAVRINGADLRCRVVGEGGNLGVSQLGRVEAALGGVHINTDAIDNSAGVDSSDDEVNIKVLMNGLIRDGVITREERDEILVAMTEDVADGVLRNNYEQNTLLGTERQQSSDIVGTHLRFMEALERAGVPLDREVEFLPTDKALLARARDGKGLVSPELAVLMAYSKLALKYDLADSALVDDPWLERTLMAYFPPAVRERFPDAVRNHPLRSEIIVNRLANTIINYGGMTFVYRATEETGATAEQVARAFVVSREVFGLDQFITDVESLDGTVSTQTQGEMLRAFRHLLDRSTHWFLRNLPTGNSLADDIERFRPIVAQYSARLSDYVRSLEREQYDASVATLSEAGVPQELASLVPALRFHLRLLDAVELAETNGEPVETVLALTFGVAEHLGIDRLHALVTPLPMTDRWDALARGAMRDDLHTVRRELTSALIVATDSQTTPDARLERWLANNAAVVERLDALLDSIEELEHANLSALTVPVGYLRTMARSSSV